MEPGLAVPHNVLLRGARTDLSAIHFLYDQAPPGAVSRTRLLLASALLFKDCVDRTSPCPLPTSTALASTAPAVGGSPILRSTSSGSTARWSTSRAQTRPSRWRGCGSGPTPTPSRSPAALPPALGSTPPCSSMVRRQDGFQSCVMSRSCRHSLSKVIVRTGSNFRLIDNDILATWAGLATGSHGVLSNGQDLGHFGVRQLLILSRFTLVPSC